MSKLAANSKYSLALSKKNVKESDLDPFDERWISICHETVGGYKEELFKDWIILSEDVTEKYVELLIQDLNSMIRIMKDYKGGDVDKMKSAKEAVREAYLEATSAKVAFDHFKEQGFSKQKADEGEFRAKKLESCREHLDKAHKYLK